MFRAVFLRELLDSFVSGKFLFITILCCSLVPLSVLVNQRALQHSAAFESRAEAEYRYSMHGAAPADQIEIRAFRPPPNLSGFAAGLDPVLPESVSLRRAGTSFGLGTVLDNPVVALFGKIDLLFIVKAILSLVAIVLSFGMICGEKESGTLRLTLANPVPRDSVLLGKMASALVVLCGPFAISVLISLLLLSLTGDRATASSGQWLAMGVMFAVSVLYLAAFIALGALVSALTRRSLVAITVLLFLWTGLVGVVPQAGGLIAETVHPVEGAESVALRKTLAAQDSERRRTRELRPFFRAPNYEDIRKPVAARYEAELQRLTAQIDRDYQNQKRAQLRLAAAISTLSPVGPLTYTLTALAGTGMEDSEHWSEALAQFRTACDRVVFSQGYRDILPGVGGAILVGTVRLEDVPQFQFAVRPLAETLRLVRGQILLLVVYIGLFFAAAYFQFRRYDVR